MFRQFMIGSGVALALVGCSKHVTPVAHTVHLNTPMGPLNLSSETEGCNAFQAFKQEGETGIDRTETIIPGGKPTQIKSVSEWLVNTEVNLVPLLCTDKTNSTAEIDLRYMISKTHTNVYMYLSPTALTAEQQAYLDSQWDSEVRPVTILGKQYYSIAFTQ